MFLGTCTSQALANDSQPKQAFMRTVLGLRRTPFFPQAIRKWGTEHLFTNLQIHKSNHFDTLQLDGNSERRDGRDNVTMHALAL